MRIKPSGIGGTELPPDPPPALVNGLDKSAVTSRASAAEPASVKESAVQARDRIVAEAFSAVGPEHQAKLEEWLLSDPLMKELIGGKQD